MARTHNPGAEPPTASRFDDFAELARRRAAGEFVLLPRHLPPEDRRLYVRQTLREDHAQRIHKRPEGAEAKFEKLAGSVYSYFRGTCLLFYRDMAGEDAWMPTVLTLGDVHPENYGVMPSEDNTPIFDVNDFDEAYYAPFTWDLKRGAVGFMIAAGEEGIGDSHLPKIAKHFLEGYLEGLRGFEQEGREMHYQHRIDNSPKLIRKLLEDAQRDRDEWLEKYVDPKTRRFEASKKIVPLPSRVGEFQAIVDAYVQRNGLDRLPSRAGELKVIDVAARKGSGTASLGLPRYWVLLDGPSGDGSDDLILEMKRARRSALAGLAPPSQKQMDGEADRVVNAQAVQLAGGDPFYGKAEIDGQSFLVRERSPFKEEIDISDLSKKKWKKYARICGTTLAQAHALSDLEADVDADGSPGGVERRVLAAVGEDELFIDDILRFAHVTVDRIYADHEAFVKDWELGALRFVDRVFV
ncbi:MAG TPA: DUF2252 family protein [Sandaracinaceae bacterium LLY-WYZ-13_1]|nr:DUF2252 family protein [Sandaracinaceae bacterium LLY-WYZ-13_1]